MPNQSETTVEMAAALRRYLEIQREEQRLQEEKAALQEQLGQHMAQGHLTYWYPELDGQRLKVRYSETAVIDYDEALLRQRLGARFTALLAPDLRKIRRALAAIAPALVPFLSIVGSPSPEKVRAAVEQGLVSKEEFAGAFKKTVKRVVAVMKAKPNEGPGRAPEGGDAPPEPAEEA